MGAQVRRADRRREADGPGAQQQRAAGDRGEVADPRRRRRRGQVGRPERLVDGPRGLREPAETAGEQHGVQSPGRQRRPDRGMAEHGAERLRHRTEGAGHLAGEDVRGRRPGQFVHRRPGVPGVLPGPWQQRGGPAAPVAQRVPDGGRSKARPGRTAPGQSSPRRPAARRTARAAAKRGQRPGTGREDGGADRLRPDIADQQPPSARGASPGPAVAHPSATANQAAAATVRGTK